MGIMDDASVIGQLPRPKEHIFLGEKAGWWEVSSEDGLAQYESFNDEFKGRWKEWIAKGCPERSDVDLSYKLAKL